MASSHLPVRCCGNEGGDPRDALLDTICGLYVKVVKRLPIHECPDLFHCLQVAGHCYGLLDPLSNILLHAIAHHNPHRNHRYNHELPPDTKIHDPSFWFPAAERSLTGLTTFLMSMYRYLTQEQAAEYLALAQADLDFAVHLIDQDFRCSVVKLEGAWVAIQDAIMFAAMAAEHPNPKRLVAINTATFGAEHANKLAAWLHADDQLGMVAVDEIYESLIYGHEPDSGQYLFYLRVKYPDEDFDVARNPAAGLDHNVKTCIHRCPSLLMGRRTAASDSNSSHLPCDYIERIEALLVDHIHALNLSVICRLQLDSMKVLHHELVVAGYMYGPFEDLVLNILINAIWYRQLNLNSSSCSSTDDDCMSQPMPPSGVFCTDLMLRTGFNALAGQVAFLCAKYGDTLSGHDAMEYLYVTKCNLVAAMELAEGDGHHAAVSTFNDVTAIEYAVKAMKHPRPAAMMALMACFTPELEDKLGDLLSANGEELSCENIEEISRLLSSHITLLPDAIPPPIAITMHPGAMAAIAQKKDDFKRRHMFLLEKVQLLLDTNYEAHTICGLTRFHLQMQKIYHVNFLASRTDMNDGDQAASLLFFAQIVWGASPWLAQEYNPFQKDWRRSFCCPVTISSSLRRCFPCELRRSKIVHPTGMGSDYFGREEKTYLDFRNYIASCRHSVHNYKKDSDFLYFDPRVNTELAIYLNQRAKKQEEMTEEEAYEAFLKEIPLR